MDTSVVLEDFFSRCRIPSIIKLLNSHSSWSSFAWRIMRNFSEAPGFSIGPLQKGQREVMYFPYVVRKNENS